MKTVIAFFALCLLFFCTALPASAGVWVVIDKSAQRLYLWENSHLRHVWKASTGLKDTYTPTGTFHPYKQIRHHISGTYGKPMAWALYYKGTRAIHGTDGLDDGKLGTRASMGCTHISNDAAKTLYDLAQKYGYANVKITIQQ